MRCPRCNDTMTEEGPDGPRPCFDAVQHWHVKPEGHPDDELVLDGPATRAVAPPAPIEPTPFPRITELWPFKGPFKSIPEAFEGFIHEVPTNDAERERARRVRDALRELLAAVGAARKDHPGMRIRYDIGYASLTVWDQDGRIMGSFDTFRAGDL